MNDIINLNSIRSNNCDCNKPKKPTCGCNNHNSIPYEPSINVGDLYFRVKNLFGELRSEWQRAEARLNLGVTDIIDLRQILASEESGGTNIWEMTVSKGGSNRVYDFVVRNGLAGKSAKISFAEPYSVEAGKNPEVENIGNPSDVILRFGIPRGERGESGEPGESAFDIANRIKMAIDGVPYANEEEWIASLHGVPGEPGIPGESNENFKVTSINLIEYKDADYLLPGGSVYSGPVGVWQVNFLNSPSMKFWVPFKTANNDIPKVKILFKIHNFGKLPTLGDLSYYLRDLYSRVNTNDSGKSLRALYDDGWDDIAPIVINSGYEFIYMATSTIQGDNVEKWSVVQLTGVNGVDGKDGKDGVDGQNCDCSGNTPEDPINPNNDSHGCQLKIQLMDEFEETVVSNHSGIIHPNIKVTLTAFNNTTNRKTFRIPNLEFEVYYETGDQDNVQHAYTLSISGIQFSLSAGQITAETVYLTVKNREYNIGGGEVHYEESDDLASYFDNFTLHSITGPNESDLPSGFLVDEAEKTILCNSYEIINSFLYHN